MRQFFRWFLEHPGDRTQSFLRGVESRLIARIIPKLPQNLEPMQLSGLGAFGACVAALIILASNSFLAVICFLPFAMAINGFGLSTDLPLARSRTAGETPVEGMAHHLAEMGSQLLIVIAYGFSPFLSVRAAIVVVLCYLLFSSYCYIRAASNHKEQMAYIGIGVTEFRFLLAFWPFLALALGVPESLEDSFPAIDVAVFALACSAFVGLGVKLFSDSDKIVASQGEE